MPGSANTPPRPRAPGGGHGAAPKTALPTAVGEGPGGVAQRNPFGAGGTVPGPRAPAQVPEGETRERERPCFLGPTPCNPAGLGLTPQAGAPGRTIHLGTSSLPRHFPTPASVSPYPPTSPLTRCHSPPHRPAAVPPSSSSPAAAAAAVCSVLVVVVDWRREIGAIWPSTARPSSASVGKPGSWSSSEKKAGSVSGYHFRNPGGQAVPALPRRGLHPLLLPSSSLPPPPYNFFPSRRLSRGSQDGCRCRRPGPARPGPGTSAPPSGSEREGWQGMRSKVQLPVAAPIPTFVKSSSGFPRAWGRRSQPEPSTPRPKRAFSFSYLRNGWSRVPQPRISSPVPRGRRPGWKRCHRRTAILITWRAAFLGGKERYQTGGEQSRDGWTKGLDRGSYAFVPRFYSAALVHCYSIARYSCSNLLRCVGPPQSRPLPARKASLWGISVYYTWGTKIGQKRLYAKLLGDDRDFLVQ